MYNVGLQHILVEFQCFVIVGSDVHLPIPNAWALLWKSKSYLLSWLFSSLACTIPQCQQAEAVLNTQK